MNHLKIITVVSLLVFIVGCSSFDKGLGLQRDPSGSLQVRNWDNLESEDIASIMQSEQMTQCFGVIREAFQSETAAAKRNLTSPTKSIQLGVANPNDAMMEMSRNQTKMFETAMKYQSHTFAYMNGMQPVVDHPLAQLANLCKSNNYFDMKMAQSESRYNFWGGVINTVTGGLVSVTPYVALGYAFKKGMDKAGTNVRGDGNKVNVNSGSGDQNNAGGIPLNPADVNPVSLGTDEGDMMLEDDCLAAGGTINELGECSDGMGGNPLDMMEEGEEVGELPAPDPEPEA